MVVARGERAARARVVLVVLFALVELNAAEPMLPMRLFRNRAFTASNLASLLMSFRDVRLHFLAGPVPSDSAGIFASPGWAEHPALDGDADAHRSGRWHHHPAHRRSPRPGRRPRAAVAWPRLARGGGVPTVPYSHLVPAFVLSGIGMSLFFAPMASTVLGAVGPGEEGIASGVNNAIREMGGVLGIAVLASVFSAAGSYASGKAFVSGLVRRRRRVRP